MTIPKSRIILSCSLLPLLLGTLTFAQLDDSDFQIVLEWSSFASELEAVLLVPSTDAKVSEPVVGSMPGTSSNQYVISSGDISTDPEIAQEIFSIRKFSPGTYQLWVKSKFIEEGFGDTDFFMGDEASAFEGSEATVKIVKNNKVLQTIRIPKNAEGLAWLPLEIDGNTQQPIEVNQTFAQLRAIHGSVIDAQNGDPINTALVIVKNRDTREVVGRDITDEDGGFILSVDPGRYDVYIGKGTYISDKFGVDILRDFPRSIHAVLSQIVPPKDYRIVLTWDRFPVDVDAHLRGPHPGHADFHLYWSNPVEINGKKYLDRDDRNSFGPETITIRDIDPGIYTYSVHNYSGRNASSGTSLSQGNIAVKVFNGDKLIKTYQLPKGASGNYWKVFKLDGSTGQFIDINKTGFISNPNSL